MASNSVPAELTNAQNSAEGSSGSVPAQAQLSSQIDCGSQIQLKNEGEILLITLPTEEQTVETTDWTDVWQGLKYRLNGDRSWQSGSTVHLIAKDRLLDGRQLQALAEILREADLQLKRICTTRRQTAVAAATVGYSVDQELPSSLSVQEDLPQAGLSEPLYLQTTVRSGIEVRHPGTVVIWGDLNPGGIVIAAGDIIVCGCLRGIAHAGAQGNRECCIMALRMEPTQLRIADIVARAPESPPEKVEPEVAYLTPTGIRLAKAITFAKTHSFSPEVQGWLNSHNQ